MTVPTTSVLDFEVYLLVTMKYGMINHDAQREAKLAEHGLSFSDADRIHRRVAELLEKESTQFANLRILVGEGAGETDSLTFKGILWPDFDFTATANGDGSIRSARYRRARGDVQAVHSPTEQPPWSMVASEFAQQFGPVTITYQSSLFDDALPAHEYHEFEWGGRRYGAGFSWGLFLTAGLLWT